MSNIDNTPATTGTPDTGLELEPLFYVPLSSGERLTARYPGGYTPIEALSDLMSPLVEAFDQANWREMEARYFLMRGARFSHADDLAAFQGQLEEAVEAMEQARWWREANIYGAPMDEWHQRADELQTLLDAETDKRFEGMTVAAMLDALDGDAFTDDERDQ